MARVAEQIIRLGLGFIASQARKSASSSGCSASQSNRARRRRRGAPFLVRGTFQQHGEKGERWQLDRRGEFVGDAGIVDREYRGEDTVAADGVSMSRGGSAATKRACRQADWEKKHRTEALESEGMRTRAGSARGE